MKEVKYGIDCLYNCVLSTQFQNEYKCTLTTPTFRRLDQSDNDSMIGLSRIVINVTIDDSLNSQVIDEIIGDVAVNNFDHSTIAKNENIQNFLYKNWGIPKSGLLL